MINGVVQFHVGLWRQSPAVKAWVGLLLTVNLVPAFFFLPAVEAWVVLAGLMASAMLMMALTARFGFSRILGLGHLVFWIPMLVYLGLRLPLHGIDSPLGQWIGLLFVIDGISLFIDTADLIRFCRGERAPLVEPG